MKKVSCSFLIGALGSVFDLGRRGEQVRIGKQQHIRSKRQAYSLEESEFFSHQNFGQRESGVPQKYRTTILLVFKRMVHIRDRALYSHAQQYSSSKFCVVTPSYYRFLGYNMQPKRILAPTELLSRCALQNLTWHKAQQDARNFGIRRKIQ